MQSFHRNPGSPFPNECDSAPEIASPQTRKRRAGSVHPGSMGGSHETPFSVLHDCNGFAFCVPLFAQSLPEINFDSVPNFLKLPADIYLGEAAGVAQNSKGHIFVFTRSGETQLFEFDPEGNFLREISPRNYAFAFAHTVRIDSQDNIWAVDEGSNMIVKFNPAGKVIMTMGRRPESAEGDVPGGFNFHPIFPETPRPARALFLQPRDRRGLGPRRKYFCLRRLRERQRREI